MSGNAPNLIDGHAYCEGDDCWNVVPDNSASDLCTDCETAAVAVVAEALKPFGFALEQFGSALASHGSYEHCDVECMVLGSNEDGYPPLSMDERCTLRVVVYTGDDVQDFFPFAGTVAELVRWMSR